MILDSVSNKYPVYRDLFLLANAVYPVDSLFFDIRTPEWVEYDDLGCCRGVQAYVLGGETNEHEFDAGVLHKD